MNHVNNLSENIKYGYNKSNHDNNSQKYLCRINFNNILIEYNYRYYQYDERETIDIYFEFEIMDEKENLLKLKKISMEYDNIYGGDFRNFTYNYDSLVEYVFKYNITNNIFNIQFENLVTNATYYREDVFDKIQKMKVALEYIQNIDLTKYQY
jgi:hypothetical protein